MLFIYRGKPQYTDNKMVYVDLWFADSFCRAYFKKTEINMFDAEIMADKL